MTGTRAFSIDTLVLQNTVPTPSPSAFLREIDLARSYQPPLHINQHGAFRPIRTLMPKSTRAIVISHINNIAQIAIAHCLY
jgi:hypothetical protein